MARPLQGRLFSARASHFRLYWGLILINSLQAYKHIFTSPSSVDSETKATRSGNARIHGMTAVTLPSIAYVATQVNLCFCSSDVTVTHFSCQVRFALSSQSTFARTDSITDTERFYNSIMVLFRNKDELSEVNELTAWWNRYVKHLHICLLFIAQLIHLFKANFRWLFIGRADS